MADQKITALTSLAQADIVSGTDVLPIVDVGAPSVTKKATPQAVVGASVNDLAQTWNAAGTTFTAIKMNATDTASAAGSLLLDLQVGSASQFKVGKSGIVTAKAQVGTITNDNAAAGQIGEIVEATVLVGSAVALTSGTSVDVTSISLTAGDWDVWGNVAFSLGGGTTITALVGWINSASATIPTNPNGGAYAHFGGDARTFPVGCRRISLASTTTIYLTVFAGFAVNTLSSFGYIGARRVR